MAGIFDFFGGGTAAPTPGLLDAAGYMDPAQYDAARRNQGMMGLWAGLLAGGGPSLEPRNFGSALGAGFTGMNQFGNSFDESQLHAAQAAQARANVGKLGAETETMRKGFEIFRKGIESGQFAGGAPGSGSTGGAPAAPGAGGDVPNFGAGLAGGSGRLASTDIYKLATEVGFKGDAAETMTAIIQGESGNRPGAIGDQNIGGSYGLTQINRKAHGDVALEALNNPRRALELAYDISKGGTDFTPWSVYKSGAYKQYLGQTQTPVEARQPSAIFPDMLGTSAIPVPAALAANAVPAPALLTQPGNDPNVTVPPTPAGAPAGNRPGANLPASGAGLITPQDYQRWLATQQAPGGDARIGIEQLAGETVPVAETPAPVPAAAMPPALPGNLTLGPGGRVMVPGAAAPAPPAPAPAPAATKPPAVTAAPAPGALTVTLPAPSAPLAPAALPAPPTPAVATLPPQPTIPAVPPRAEVPGGGAPGGGYNAQAHQAQMMALGLTMMGRTVPGYISDMAGIPAAAQKAAAEAGAKQPFEQQNKQFQFLLDMAKSTWEKASDFEKQRIADINGFTKEQYKAQLDQIGEDRKAQQAQQGDQYKKQLEIVGTPAIEGAKARAKAENEQTTMVIGGQRVPMTVADANRISRGEPPEQVLGPHVLRLGEQYLTEAEKQRNEALALEYKEKTLADYNKAAAGRPQIVALGNALENFRTGPTADTKLALGKYAQDFVQTMTGQPADPNSNLAKWIASGEIINKTGTQLGFELSRTLGANEAASIVNRAIAANPGLLNSPTGNRTLVQMFDQVFQRDTQKRYFVDQYFRTHRTYDGAVEAFNKQSPVEVAVSKAVPYRPTGKADLDALPSGVTFIAPDGSARIKP